MTRRFFLYRTILLIASSAVLLGACGNFADGSFEPDIEPLQTAQIGTISTPMAQVTETPVPTQTQTIEITDDLIEYNLVAELNKQTMTLDVVETIQFTNGRQQPVENILLSVQPNTYPNGFVLNMVRVDGEARAYSLNGQALEVTNVPLEYAEVVEIQLDFSITLPRAVQGDPSIVRPQIYGYTDRQINLIDWYPMLPARDANGEWLLHPIGFYGENLVYPLSSGFISLELINFDPMPVSAASAPSSVSENTLIYKFVDFRDFSIMLSDSMAYFEDEIDGMIIRSYYFPGYQTGGQAVLVASVEAVKLFTTIFGPINNPIISAVQGDFEDGMEYEGLYYLSNSFYNLYDGEADQYLVMVAAHETCHQWFFGNVANDQAIEPWLDESLATYCEKLFYETYYPQYLDWWWAARIDYYQPQGFIDGDIYGYHGFDPYTNAVYRQGANFYEDLRILIGDEAFFAFLQDYHFSMGGKISTAEDYFSILRRHTNADLEALISEYFYRKY